MTVREIAAMLKVAPSTVSIVLNDKPGVRAELRQKIRGILEENGYTIKTAPETAQEARNKITQTTPATFVSESNSKLNGQKTIMCIYYENTNYMSLRDDMVVSFMNEIQRRCQEMGMNFLYFVTNEHNIHHFFSRENLSHIDGIVLMGTEYFGTLDPAILNCSVPVTILDGYFPFDPVDTVNNDNTNYAYVLFDYILSMGHTSLGYIKSKPELGSLGERSVCIRLAADANPVKLPEKYIVEVGDAAEDIIDQVTVFLKRRGKDLPTLFICDNDYIAVAAMQAIQRSGLRIPEDISIIGVDNSELSKIIFPRLTTFQSSFKEMARMATNRLIERMAMPNLPAVKINVSLQLVEGSTVKDLSK